MGKWERLCTKLVDSMNENNVPINEYDRYKLSHMYPCNIYHMAAIYHEGNRCTDEGWGMIYWTRADWNLPDFETACKRLLEIVLKKRYNVEFETEEELALKMNLLGINT